MSVAIWNESTPTASMWTHIWIRKKILPLIWQQCSNCLVSGKPITYSIHKAGEGG